MSAISSSSVTAHALPISPVAPVAAASASADASFSAAPAASDATDALAAMRPAMDAVSAVGVPMDTSSAAAVLASGGSYVAGAQATVAKLEVGIVRRQERLELLEATDPAAAATEREQIDLLQRLRDRIKLSIERVSDLITGKDRDDIEAPTNSTDPLETQSRLHDDQEKLEQARLLEQRRQLLAPQGLTPTSAPDTTRVASAYATTSAYSAVAS